VDSQLTKQLLSRQQAGFGKGSGPFKMAGSPVTSIKGFDSRSLFSKMAFLS
jgi:hypothetical protein